MFNEGKIAGLESDLGLSSEGSEVEKERRKKLSQDFFDGQKVIKEDGKKSSLTEALQSVPEYYKIEGTHSEDDPLSALEVYISTGLIDEKSSLDDIERALNSFLEIGKEAQKDKPNIKDVDEILSSFLSERLDHFEKTLDQRIKLSPTAPFGETGISMAKQVLRQKPIVGDFRSKTLASIKNRVTNNSVVYLGKYAYPSFYDDLQEGE